MVRPNPRYVGALSLAGGGLWLSGFGLLMTVPNALSVGYVSAPVILMAGGAVLIGAAVGATLPAAGADPAMRALGLTALVATGAVMLLGLAALAVVGDEDRLWNVIDPELVSWWGLMAFMGAMALATALATPRRISRASVAWGAALLGAAGQAVAYALASFGVPAVATATFVILFGSAWIAIGLGVSAQARVAPAGEPC